MRNYNKITQNSFNPTTFSILTNNSSDLKKIKFYLDTGLYDKCLNISNITNLISLGGHKRWKHKFVNLLEINGRVLDIATGTGDIAILIKKMHLGYDEAIK